MKKTHIAVIGNIGVGKSTLVSQLCQSPRIQSIFSNQSITPYYEEFNKTVLHAYYSNPKRYAFLAQIEFLNDRMERLSELSLNDGLVIEDRFIYEDYYIFGKAQKILSHMSEEEFNVYTRTWKNYIKNLLPPDLIIFLKASVNTCMERLRHRNRLEERPIDEKYLSLLDVLYNQFTDNYTCTPIITIDANQSLPIKEYTNHVIDQVEQVVVSSTR